VSSPILSSPVGAVLVIVVFRTAFAVLLSVPSKAGSRGAKWQDDVDGQPGKIKNLRVAVIKYEEGVVVQSPYSWAQPMMG